MLPLMRSRSSAAVNCVDLTTRPQLTAAELRERMSGNICRCGAYSNIVDAVVEVAGRGA